MRTNIASVCALASMFFFIIFVGLYAYALVVSPNLYSHPQTSFPDVSLKKTSIAVNKYNGGQMVIFNGPIPNDTASWGPSNNTNNEKVLCGYGVTYKSIYIDEAGTKESSWWTLMISLWYPIIIFGIWPAFVVFKKLSKYFLSIRTRR
jgi:hypothetical protein